MLILIDLYNEKYDLWIYPEKYFRDLQNEFPDVEFKYIKEKSEYFEFLPIADAVIGWRLLEDDFPKAEKLRWYHTMAAGIGTMFYEKFVQSDIVLTNSAGVRGAPMADYIIAYMIMLGRRLPFLHKAQMERKWARYDIWNEIDRIVDLDMATAGIIGLGGTGMEVAERAKACGMRVIGTKRNVDVEINSVDKIFPYTQMDDVLKESDFVVLTLPHTIDTDKIISTREFEIMKETAFIINVGRGKLIDTDALIHALQNKIIAGAALDVADPEPPPADSPLWDMENVILTPHTSGIGPNFWKRSQPLVKDNIKAFINGEPMKNVVDKKLQY